MSIPFDIPADVLAQVVSGAFRREGAFIRNVASGQIVRVLQETGSATHLLAASTNPVAATVQAVAAVAAIGQNEQIKAGIATLRVLGLSNLALSVAGLGVSVAGFAVVSVKLRRIEEEVKAVGDRLDRLAAVAEELRRQPVRDDLTDLTTACEQADEAWTLASPEDQWRRAGEALHRLQNRFLNRARVAQSEGERIEVLTPLIDALTLARSIRVSARLATGDETAARAAAAELAQTVRSLTGELGAASVLRQRLRIAQVQPGSANYRSRAEAEKADAVRSANSLRDREQRVAALPILLSGLQEQDVRGRDWLSAAREADEPLLSLKL